MPASYGGSSGGSGGSGPTTPALALLDAASPNEVVILDESGEGASAPFEDVATTGIAEALSDAAEGDFLVATGAGEVQRASVDPAAVRGVIGAAPGATIVDPLTGAGWTETEAASTSATWTSGEKATLTASSGATGRVEIQQPAPIPSTAQRWSYLARVDVTAGDITSSTGYVALVALVDTNNFVYVRMRASDITLVYTIAGSATTSTHTAPTDVQRTGGQLWLSLSGSAEGRWVARWGVGTAGAVPTVWTTLTILDVPALSAAVPATAGPELWVGSVGGAPLAATHTVDVLAFRSTWEGTL